MNFLDQSNLTNGAHPWKKLFILYCLAPMILFRLYMSANVKRLMILGFSPNTRYSSAGWKNPGLKNHCILQFSQCLMLLLFKEDRYLPRSSADIGRIAIKSLLQNSLTIQSAQNRILAPPPHQKKSTARAAALK